MSENKTFDLFEYLKKQKDAEAKMDDAERCERYDGECEICGMSGKCRFTKR